MVSDFFQFSAFLTESAWVEFFGGEPAASASQACEEEPKAVVARQNSVGHVFRKLVFAPPFEGITGRDLLKNGEYE